MSDLGFWNQAQANPARRALVAPDGSELTAGELMARANRLAHGLRALGIEAGDAVATVLPNGVEMIEAYLATFQIGCYLVPINHHLVGPEIAYIVNDSEARALIAHERFAEPCRGPPARSRSHPSAGSPWERSPASSLTRA
jgi:long-chain acyl-CoA synthetase